MKAPITIVEERIRLVITGYDILDILILVSLLMITIKFWNWIL